MLVGTVSLHAQQPALSPSISPTPGSAAKSQAYVRFWNMLIGPNAPELQLMESEKQPMTIAQAGNFFAGYIAVDPGTYTFTVRRPNDPNAVVKRLPIILRGDVYVTLLAAVGKDGKPDVQIIDDTVDPKTDDGLAKITVRQFFPGASVMVGVGVPPTGMPLNFGDSTAMGGLPVRMVTINLQATGLGPTPKNWSVETDFAGGGHHATVLVVPDPYGRFRPRVVFDGSARKPAPPPPPPSASSPPRPSL